MEQRQLRRLARDVDDGTRVELRKIIDVSSPSRVFMTNARNELQQLQKTEVELPKELKRFSRATPAFSTVKRSPVSVNTVEMN